MIVGHCFHIVRSISIFYSDFLRPFLLLHYHPLFSLFRFSSDSCEYINDEEKMAKIRCSINNAVQVLPKKNGLVLENLEFSHSRFQMILRLQSGVVFQKFGSIYSSGTLCACTTLHIHDKYLHLPHPLVKCSLFKYI